MVCEYRRWLYHAIKKRPSRLRSHTFDVCCSNWIKVKIHKYFACIQKSDQLANNEEWTNKYSWITHMVNFVNRNDQILWYTFISLHCVCWLIDYCHNSYILNARFYFFHFIEIFITFRTQYKHRYLNVSLSTVEYQSGRSSYVHCFT